MTDRALESGYAVPWPAPSWIRGWSTTRAIDLGFNGNSPQAEVERQRSGLAARLGISPLWLDQVHGTTVLEPGAADRCADAAVVTSPGLASVVLTADCLPVLFCHGTQAVVAAAHAGWRGLAAGVLEKTVEKMAVDPAGIMAWLGPAIGPTAFEVGDEVRQTFLSWGDQAQQGFCPGADGRWMADLGLLARLRLARIGVTRVFGGRDCTWSQPNRYFSYRRERDRAGRMAHLVWMVEE